MSTGKVAAGRHRVEKRDWLNPRKCHHEWINKRRGDYERKKEGKQERMMSDKSAAAAAAAAKSLQSCPTLCDPIDGSPPGSPVHGILQARTLEWVAISFSNA